MMNNMMELNLNEIENVSGGWEGSQLTPEEYREYKELLAASFKAVEDNDRERFAEIFARIRDFSARMKAIYG